MFLIGRADDGDAQLFERGEDIGVHIERDEVGEDDGIFGGGGLVDFGNRLLRRRVDGVLAISDNEQVLRRETGVEDGAAGEFDGIPQRGAGGGRVELSHEGQHGGGIKRAEGHGFLRAIAVEDEESGVDFARRAAGGVGGEVLDALDDRLQCAVGDGVFGHHLAVAGAHRLAHAPGGVVENGKGDALLVSRLGREVRAAEQGDQGEPVNQFHCANRMRLVPHNEQCGIVNNRHPACQSILQVAEGRFCGSGALGLQRAIVELKRWRAWVEAAHITNSNSGTRGIKPC